MKQNKVNEIVIKKMSLVLQEMIEIFGLFDFLFFQLGYSIYKSDSETVG